MSDAHSLQVTAPPALHASGAPEVTSTTCCNAEATLKAAAQAAAKRALANVTTVFFDDADTPPQTSESWHDAASHLRLQKLAPQNDAPCK